MELAMYIARAIPLPWWWSLAAFFAFSVIALVALVIVLRANK